MRYVLLSLFLFGCTAHVSDYPHTPPTVYVPPAEAYDGGVSTGPTDGFVHDPVPDFSTPPDLAARDDDDDDDGDCHHHHNHR